MMCYSTEPRVRFEYLCYFLIMDFYFLLKIRTIILVKKIKLKIQKKKKLFDHAKQSATVCTICYKLHQNINSKTRETAVILLVI